MPLIVDPALQASVIRQFNLKGELAPFNLTENVVPIFDIGRLVGSQDPTVVTTLFGSQGIRIGIAGNNRVPILQNPYFLAAEAFDSGLVVNPAAAAVLVDSGQVTNANKTAIVTVSTNTKVDFAVEWRNAANSATLATWTVCTGDAFSFPQINLSNMLTDERLRVITVGGVTGTVAAHIDLTSSNPSQAA